VGSDHRFLDMKVKRKWLLLWPPKYSLISFSEKKMCHINAFRISSLNTQHLTSTYTRHFSSYSSQVYNVSKQHYSICYYVFIVVLLPYLF
jgi:hypothetical protein